MYTMPDPFSFQTKPWRRSPNSWATTIPQNILAIKSARMGENARVDWSINEETGVVEVEFVEVDDGD